MSLDLFYTFALFTGLAVFFLFVGLKLLFFTKDYLSGKRITEQYESGRGIVVLEASRAAALDRQALGHTDSLLVLDSELDEELPTP